jgi:TonB family protein
MLPRPRSSLGRSVLAAALCLVASAADAQDQRRDDRGRPIDQPEEAPGEQRITLPEPLLYVAPVYPPEAKAQGLEGVVVLRLVIDEKGDVVEASVAEGAGHGFDEAALAAARKLKFEPARYADGTPFKAAIKYEYEFSLAEEVVEPPAATTGTFAGKILIQGAEAPLAGARLTLTGPDGATLEVFTDAAGRFSFDELEEGSYRLSIRAPGYDELALTENVVGGEAIEAVYRVNAEATGGAIDVFVEAERPPREITRRTLQRREIERIPGTNGDALRSITSLPGVARPPAIAGVLLVRGSAPQDTLTFVDGVYVPLIYHFGGLSSVVPTEMLSKIDFYPGNFSARYGRAQGGIVDAGIRSPADEYHGLVQIDLIDARLLAEGPIPLLEGWTFAVAGRRSHLDAWLGPVLEEAGAGVTTAPRYYDYQLLVERKWDSKDLGQGKLRTSFYGSDDALEILIGEPVSGEPALSGNLSLRTVFQRLQVGYEHQMTPDDRVGAQLAFAHDALGLGLGAIFLDLDILSFVGRAEYTRRLASVATVNVGFDILVGEANVAAQGPSAPVPGQPPNQPFSTRNTISINQVNSFYRPAAYLEAELTPLSRWRLVPGLRFDYSRDTESLDVSPRFNTRFDILEGFPRTTLKGGVGVFRQPPGFQETVEPLGTAGIRSNYAVHYGLGAEQEITRQLEVSVEGFYKQLEQQVIARPQASGAFTEYANAATGYAGGMELLVKYKPDEHFFGWVAYTLSRSVRRNAPDLEEYLVAWDQTHILTMLGSYRFGSGWELGARFRLVSGNLTSPNVCNPSDQDCDPSRINALFHAASGAYTPIRFGATNTERLPMFHALDLRVDKKWQFSAWAFSAYLDIQNAYNNQNVEGISYNFDFTGRQYVTGLPILPSIGLRGEF